MTVIWRHREGSPGTPGGHPHLPNPSRRATIVVLAILSLILAANQAFREPGPAERHLIDRIQGLDLLPLSPLLRITDWLTYSSWSLVVWLPILVVPIVRRQWSIVVAAFFIPIGVLVAHGVPGATFPDVQVVASVLLFGLLFIAAGRFAHSGAKHAVRGFSVAFIVLTGLVQIWQATAWPADVLAGFVLGAIFLTVVASIVRRLAPVVDGLPFAHAMVIPHDETAPHAHALTSTILFRGETVAKIYAPGFLPRALYWLAFQGPFAYEHNLLALKAAVLRRSLAGLLTEFWYGSNRVARAVGIETIGGRPALIGEFVAGTEPRDKHAAHRFLRDLADHFDEAGLPTWQIDPRQPRSLGNLLERSDGSYAVIDLESGLVSPLASPRAWWRAIRRGLVPIYDDLYFDLTRVYVEDHAEAMRSSHGDTWLNNLRVTLDEAESATRDWHQSEPRLWSRLVRGIWTGFGVRTWPARVRAQAAQSHERASHWFERAVDAWKADGRLSDEEVDCLHDQIASPEFQAVLPHMGVHMATGIVLRFPLGSITRAAYVIAFETAATFRLLFRRIDRTSWRQTMAIHSPLVLLLAAMPGIGAFSYLASKPFLANRLLCRVATDAVALKLPWQIYERSGLRYFVARQPVSKSSTAAPIEPPAATMTVALLPKPATIGRLFGAVAALLFAADLFLQLIDRLFQPSFLGWSQILRIFHLNSEASLGTWLSVVGLTLCSSVLFLIASIERRTGSCFARHWFALAVIVLGFSVDEQAKLHDLGIGAQVREYITLPGLLYYGWVIVAFASIVVVAITFKNFFVALPLPTRAWFLLAAVTYVSGEVGMEMIGGWYTDHYGATGFVFTVMTATEEILGLVGVGLALYALLSYVREEYGDVRVRLGNPDRLPDRRISAATVAPATGAKPTHAMPADKFGDSYATR